MSKNKDLKVNIDCDTRDLQISVLTMQNSVLKMQLALLKNDTQLTKSQRTVKQAKEEFLNRVVTAFKEDYGYKVESASSHWDESVDFNNGVRPRKSFCVEITTVGAI